MLKEYISAYLSPLIEEFANCVEHKNDIEAGNSFRGMLNALGQFLRAFKELIIDGVCWFPRLMRWKTSRGEVAPVFSDYRNEGYDYRLKAYMNVVTKEKYSIESIQGRLNRKIVSVRWNSWSKGLWQRKRWYERWRERG